MSRVSAAAGEDSTGNKATARVLRILSTFVDGDDSLGVTEISQRLGMTKSMVHRGLMTLLRHGYVLRDPSGTRYQLGPAIADFGTLWLKPPDIHLLCRPFEDGLFDLTGETVSIHVPIGNNVVCVDGVEGRGPVARRVPLGGSIPLHVSPAGRVVLAYLPDEEIERYLSRPLRVFTKNTLRTPEQVWAHVRKVRENGYADFLGDHYPKAVGSSVSFPILDINGEPHGSITVAGPIDRLPPDRIRTLVPELAPIIAALNRQSRLYVSGREPVPE